MLNRRTFLKTAGAVAALARFQPVLAATTTTGGRTVLSLNQGWRFHEGDIVLPKARGHAATYATTKAGEAPGAAAFDFDDSQWANVTLPHDFASYQLPQEEDNIVQGYRKRGIGWYRTTMRFEEADRGKHIELQLDGISTFATVWFNGTQVAHNYSGYNAIYVDLTALVTYGDALNVLAIRADAEAMQGWWYEGAGIYRNTRIVKRAPIHIVTDGVYAHPVQDDGGWRIPFEATLYNILNGAQQVEVAVDVLGPDGAVVAQRRLPFEIGELSRATCRAAVPIADPKLWSVEQRNLYTVRTRVLQNAQLLDEVDTRIGFRTQRFDAARGFFLNGQHVKLQGVCIHQDHAGVGVAVPYGLLEWRMRRLKELGANAIRCSHHAQDPRFYELCDELGFLVMDENRVFNVAPVHMQELEWLVRCHRNHPSIIMWSVFNEEPMQGTEQGYQMVRRMRALVHSLDPRPVTAAQNFGMFEPVNVSQAVDVVGFNYSHRLYDAFHKAFPQLPLTSSEDTSAYMTRGEYKTDPARHVIASLDDDAAFWGNPHRLGWKEVAERDHVAGGFVWTGFDYHGEPTPHAWPTNSSFFGIMDLCGFAKNAFWIHQAQWRREPVLRLAPHWDWPDKLGQPITVLAMHNLDEVELFLNGRSLGRQKGDIYDMNRWSVPYAPGKLSARGWRGGKEVASFAVETTGAPVALRLTPDRVAMRGDGVDAQPIQVEALDARGRHVPLAQHQIHFAIEGGDIIGLGNGNPNDITSEKGDTRALFNGLAQVIVQSRAVSVRPLRLTASTPGLKSAVLSIEVKRADPPAYPATSAPVQMVTGWRASPFMERPMAPDLRPSDNDMNSWMGVNAGGRPTEATEDGYVLYAAQVQPFARIRQAGGMLEFTEWIGTGEVFIDGRLVASKTAPAAAPFRIALAPGMAPFRLTLRHRLVKGTPYGLTGVVRVR